jgi:hypothetical protein
MIGLLCFVLAVLTSPFKPKFRSFAPQIHVCLIDVRLGRRGGDISAAKAALSAVCGLRR